MNKRFLVVLIILIVVLLIILTIKVIKTFSTTRQVNNYQYNIEENNQILNEENVENNIEKNIITVEVNNEVENKVEQNIEESHIANFVENNVEKENMLKDNVEEVPDEPEEIVEEPTNDVPQTSNFEFDSRVAFIGDSRTQAFLMYTGLKNVIDYTNIGLMVDTAVTKKFVKSANGEKVTILQDLKTKNIDKIYIMLGVNELRLGI